MFPIRSKVRAGCLAALCFLLSNSAAAAAPAPPAASGAEVPALAGLSDAKAPQAKPATLVVLNRPIITFRAPFLGNPPEERVRAAYGRIVKFRESSTSLTVTQKPESQGIFILIDGVFVFVVTPGDVDVLGGDTLESTAAAAIKSLELIIAETREGRSLRVMGTAFVYAAIATATFVALLWLLWWARRWISAQAQKLARMQTERLRIGEAPLMQSEQIVHIVQRLSNGALTLLALFLTYAWLDYALQRFPYTRRWGEQLHSYLVSTATLLIDGMLDALPNLLIAILIFLIARFFVRVMKGFFERVQQGRVEIGWLDADTAGPTSRIFSLLIWAFALVMAYPYLPGANTDAFKGISVLLGLMVSIGASSTIGQAASGLILMYTRTIRVGEYVRIGDHEGTVTELGMFTTRIRTGMGEELTLPNSMVVGAVTKNYSRVSNGRGYVVDTTVTIGYDAPWRQIHALLLEAAKRTDGIMQEPPPRVFQTALSDFYVEYRLSGLAIPSDPRPRAEVLNALHQHIQDVFNEHGVQIMSPHYLGDPPQAKVVPVDQWYAAPAQKPSDAASR